MTQILGVIFRDFKDLAAQSMMDFVFVVFRCLKMNLSLFIW